MYLDSWPGASLLTFIYTSSTPSPPGHRVGGYSLSSLHIHRRQIIFTKFKKSNCSPIFYGGGGVVNREIIIVKKTNFNIYKEQEMYLFNFKPFPYNTLIIFEKATKLKMNKNLSPNTGPSTFI